MVFINNNNNKHYVHFQEEMDPAFTITILKITLRSAGHHPLPNGASMRFINVCLITFH